jgi:hypothetical protein
MISLASFVLRFISHMDMSSLSMGIRNLEWAVQQFGSNKEATPDDATASTIFFCALRYDTIVFHREVFPVPP